MPEAFRSFTSILLAATTVAAPAEAAAPLDPVALVAASVSTSVEGGGSNGETANAKVAGHAADPRVADLLDGFAAELKRLTVRAAELLEERAETLLTDLATRVLGRELQTAPAEIAALLAQTLAEFGVKEAFVVRVSRADASRLQAAWPAQIDPELRAGDFAVDVDDGSYEVALQTRLDAMLAQHRVSL